MNLVFCGLRFKFTALFLLRELSQGDAILARIGNPNPKQLARDALRKRGSTSLESAQRKLRMSQSGHADKSGFPSASQDFDAILDKAKSGDSEAMGQLFEVCQKYLLLIANQDLNPKIMQKFGASDVVQQTMLIANRQLPEFRGSTKGEFLAWMKRILINECRSSTRRYAATAKRSVSKERPVTSGRGSEQTDFDLRDPHLTPSTQASLEEQTALMQKALLELGLQDRGVIEMRNWQELSFSVIGDKLGKTEEAARKIWSRAILKLEKRLREMGAI